MLSLLAVFVLVMTVANGCVSDDRNDNIDASEEVVRIRVAPRSKRKLPYASGMVEV